MKITALAENTSERGLKTVHGLSLYIETRRHRILFDVGPDDCFIENARALGVDLEGVDTVILSHGHSDHGGALERLFDINGSARVYAQRKAFDRYFARHLQVETSIGLPARLRSHPRVVLCDGDHELDGELTLLVVTGAQKYRSEANDVLYSETGRDDFSHEHSLMISGEESALILGCGHTGVVNILEKALPYEPEVCVGGYHLWNPMTKKTVSSGLLDGIAAELSKYKIRYYTCHCTGREAFEYLSRRVPDMSYLRCGDTITI